MVIKELNVIMGNSLKMGLVGNRTPVFRKVLITEERGFMCVNKWEVLS